MSAVISQPDSHLRSLGKTFSWRILATVTTMAVAYAITGQLDTAIAIGSIEFVLKLLLYYGHERMWLLVPNRNK
jgi:uncharacterized membrane protein